MKFLEFVSINESIESNYSEGMVTYEAKAFQGGMPRIYQTISLEATKEQLIKHGILTKKADKTLELNQLMLKDVPPSTEQVDKLVSEGAEVKKLNFAPFIQSLVNDWNEVAKFLIAKHWVLKPAIIQNYSEEFAYELALDRIVNSDTEKSIKTFAIISKHVKIPENMDRAMYKAFNILVKSDKVERASKMVEAMRVPSKRTMNLMFTSFLKDGKFDFSNNKLDLANQLLKKGFGHIFRNTLITVMVEDLGMKKEDAEALAIGLKDYGINLEIKVSSL